MGILNNDITVYDVQREDGKGKTRTLHHNMLLQLNTLLPVPALSVPHNSAKSAPKPVDPQPHSSDYDYDNSSASSVVFFIPQRHMSSVRNHDSYQPTWPADSFQPAIVISPDGSFQHTVDNWPSSLFIWSAFCSISISGGKQSQFCFMPPIVWCGGHTATLQN